MLELLLPICCCCCCCCCMPFIPPPFPEFIFPNMFIIEFIPLFAPTGLDVGLELPNASNAGCGCGVCADENALNAGCCGGAGADEPNASNVGCCADPEEPNEPNASFVDCCSTGAGTVGAEAFAPNASNAMVSFCRGGSFDANKSPAGSSGVGGEIFIALSFFFLGFFGFFFFSGKAANVGAAASDGSTVLEELLLLLEVSLVS